MKKDKKEISPWGKQCKVQMVVLGKSLGDLSVETKLSRTYISSIINGRMIPPEDTIKTITGRRGPDKSIGKNFDLACRMERKYRRSFAVSH